MNFRKCDDLDYVLLPEQQPDNDIFRRGLKKLWGGGCQPTLCCLKEAQSKAMNNLIINRAEGVVLPATQAMS